MIWPLHVAHATKKSIRTVHHQPSTVDPHGSIKAPLFASSSLLVVPHWRSLTPILLSVQPSFDPCPLLVWLSGLGIGIR